MERKKAERVKRLAGESSPSVPDSAASSVDTESSEILLGMLSFVSGVSDSSELATVAEKCRLRGRDLKADLDSEKAAEFSSRQPEAERGRSSRSLFS